MAHYTLLTFLRLESIAAPMQSIQYNPEIMITDSGAELSKDTLLLKAQSSKKQTLQTNALKILTVAILANEESAAELKAATALRQTQGKTLPIWKATSGTYNSYQGTTPRRAK